MYADGARFYDVIHEGRGRDADAEAALVVGEIRRRVPTARTLLDVGCGTGAHLPRFASDFAVVGVDLSPQMLRFAAERAPGVPLVEGDFRTFDLGTTFDVVVSLFSGIGYLTERADLDAAIGNLARHVAPGGLLVIEGWVEPDHWLGSAIDSQAARRGDLAVARVSRSYREGAITTVDMRYTAASADGLETLDECHRMRLSDPDELAAAYERAGLTFERLPHLLHAGRSLYVGAKDSRSR